MTISKDMILDSIDISELILKENLAQPTMPNKADTAKYNSVIKPRIDDYKAKYGDSPRMILQKSLQQYCLLYTSPSPRDRQRSRMPSSA